MSLSGYCFASRESLLPHAQTADGPAISAIRSLCAELKVYLALGVAELVESTGTLHNSAFLIDDRGQILGRFRKINAESRWACPGDQIQDNVWPTPWGQAALLVCADSWHSLIARIVAVKGADLLLLPANWPATGLDPRELWRFRALENGLWLLACNRGGQEINLDCREAHSCAYDPYGRELFAGQSPESAVFLVDLPLNAEGKLDSQRRREILAQRRIDRYYRLYGNFNGLKDLTGFLKLPEPGELGATALVPARGQSPADFSAKAPWPLPEGLLLWPKWPYSPEELELLSRLAEGRAGLAKNAAGEWVFLGGLAGAKAVPETDGLCFVDYGSARLWLAEEAEIVHPEAAVAAAKWGADLAVALVDSLTPERRLLAALRPIDQLATALAAPDGAAMGLPWQGHDPGRGVLVGPGEMGGLTIDTREIRDKRFQDRLDFAALFRPVA
jgi:predicted amidohydrolase